ncbi:hypothetical protein MMC12_002794 [Toensbergia leucococca]|nr:hypothetical protein [Toensbergia leucococca]
MSTVQSSSTLVQPSPSLLLSIPTELRLEIYDHVFFPYKHKISRPDPEVYFSLLSTNRQIYFEARKLAKNRFNSWPRTFTFKPQEELSMEPSKRLPNGPRGYNLDHLIEMQSLEIRLHEPASSEHRTDEFDCFENILRSLAEKILPGGRTKKLRIVFVDEWPRQEYLDHIKEIIEPLVYLHRGCEVTVCMEDTWIYNLYYSGLELPENWFTMRRREALANGLTR